MKRDWSKHGLTQPPEGEVGQQAWMTDAFWIIFEKLDAVEVTSVRTQSWWAMQTVLVRGSIALVGGLLALAHITASITEAVAALVALKGSV